MKNLNQSGFSAIEAVLLVVIVAIIGGTGYFVWHAKQNTDKSLNDTANSQPGIAKASKITDFAGCKAATGSKLLETYPEQCVTKSGQKFTNQQYLEIKEWGIKLPLTSPIASVVYSSGQYSTGTSSATGGTAKLGLPSLGSDCGDSSGAPLGLYVRFTQSDVQEEDVNNIEGGPSLHDLAKSAVTLDGYMYAYAHSQFACSDNASTLNAATTALRDAIKSLKSADK
jgi:hypothetical protein